MKKFPLIVALGLFALILGSVPTLNYVGVCQAGERFGQKLTGAEKIRLAVERYRRISEWPAYEVRDHLDSLRMTEPACLQQSELKHLPYESVEELLALNLGCCRISETGYKGYPRTLLSRVSGRNAGFVTGQYEVRYMDADGSICSYTREIALAVTNCGDLWNGF